MINYFKWPKKRISTTSLLLDYENPRLTNYGKKPTQKEIIQYLLENEEIFDLAKSIAQQGYFLNEQPIVTKENNKFIVLEGNRRVAACKILINPDLITNSSKRSAIKNAVKHFDLNLISKLDVVISPSRNDADVMIVNRHTEGSVVKKWDKTKQDRFFYNRVRDGETIEELSTKFSISKSDLKKALQRYNIFLEINKLKLSEKSKEIIREEVDFNITNVERVYDSKYGRDFLGIEFDNSGRIVKKLPVIEFEKRLTAIVQNVIDGEINSRSLNKEEDKQKYFDRLLKTGNFNIQIKPDIKYNDEYNSISEEPKNNIEKEATDKQSKKAATKKDRLVSTSIHFETGNKRIDEIFIELKNISLKSHRNAASCLLRSYIDMVTYQFLKNNGIDDLLRLEGEKLTNNNEKTLESLKKYLKDAGINLNKLDDAKILRALKLKGSLSRDFIPSLRYMLEYLTKSDIIQESKLKSSLQSYINKNDKIEKIIGHNEFNLLVHNEYYINDADELKSAWDKLEPILDYMVNEIKKAR